jgi:hypothetical protein
VQTTGGNEGETTKKSCLLTAQNTKRKDEGFFSLSLATPNSAEKMTPNNVVSYRRGFGLVGI